MEANSLATAKVLQIAILNVWTTHSTHTPRMLRG